MRPLDPHRMFADIGSTVHDDLAGARDLARLLVERKQPDGAMTGIKRLVLGRRPVVNDVGMAIVVEKERRIDPIDLRKCHCVGPRSSRMFSSYIEIAALGNVGRNHVEETVVIPNRRSKNASGNASTFERQLTLAI